MRRNIEETRSAFLAEGRKMLLEKGLPLNISNIRLADIARRIGKTTGASYNIWESQEDFHRDLAVIISKDSSWADLNFLGPLVWDLFNNGATMSEVLRDACNEYLKAVTSGREYLTFVHYWSVALDQPEVKAAIRDGYDLFNDGYKALLTVLFDRYHVELIAGITIDDLCVCVTAVTEGFLLRYSVDPERIRYDIVRDDLDEANEGWSTYSMTLDKVIRSMTQPIAES